MINWTLALIVVVLVLGGLFSVLVIFSLSRSATGGDLDWQLARLERKVDLILTHLGISHDGHVPELWSTLPEMAARRKRSVNTSSSPAQATPSPGARSSMFKSGSSSSRLDGARVTE